MLTSREKRVYAGRHVVRLEESAINATGEEGALRAGELRLEQVLGW
jgi:hypothetical protein